MKNIYLVTTLSVFLLALTLLMVPVVAATSLFSHPQAESDSVSIAASDDPAMLPAPSEKLFAPLGAHTAYASELQSNEFIGISLSQPQTLTNLAASPAIFAADLAADNAVVYAINSNNADNNQFITFDPTDPLTLTVVGSIQALDGETWTGMAVTTDTIYASSSNCGARSTLYTINPFSGVATDVGQMTGSDCIQAISFDGSGNLWAVDIISDTIVSVDTTTGATSPAANPLGIDLRSNQGMDYDDASGELYLAALNRDNRLTELYTVALTGTATLVGQLGNLGSLDTQFGWLGIEGTPQVIPALPAISLEKSVGTEAATCATEDHIFVDAGETVYYCYTVTNIGQVTFTNHTLLDDPLGTLVDDLALTLVPSDSYQHIEAATINATTINTATWRANQAGANETSAMDTAMVTIIPENGSAPNAAIPDDNATGVMDTITISETGNVADLDVYVEIEHPWVGDLVVTLEHLESDVTVTLIERPEAMARASSVPGDCNGNDIRQTLDDEAALSIQSDCQAGANPTQAYQSGISYQPADSFEAFALADVPYAGTWQLRVVDQAPTQEGTFVLWALQGTVGDPEIAVTPLSIEATQESDETSTHALSINNSGDRVLTWEISSDVPWASVDMISGTTPVDDGSDLSVTFDSTGLASGTYTGTLAINNNDPDEDPVTIPLQLMIKEVVLNPEIEVMPLNLESIQEPNTTTLESLLISNTGDAGLTWTIAIDVPWASVDVSSGSTPIGDSSELMVTFDSTGLAEDTYNGILSITNNDPNENPVNVPLILTVEEVVTPQPDIDITPTQLEALLLTNNSTSEGLTIGNNGDALLTWTIGIDVPWASVDISSGSTPINDSSDLLVIFNSTGLAPNTYNGVLSISNNDPNENPLNVPLMLTVEELPEADIDVTPTELEAVLVSNDTTSEGLTIGNNGNALLTWSIAIDVAWASVDMTSGSTAAGGNSDLLVTFDSTGLAENTYTGLLSITSNDPNENPINVPLTLTVDDGITPQANINVTPSTLQSHQALNSSTTQALAISNSGDALLTWDISSDVAWASVDMMNGSTAADEETALVVTFDSSGLAGGIYTGSLTINNNDPDENPVIVPLRLSMNIPTPVKLAAVSIESRSITWALPLLVSTLLLLGGGYALGRVRRES